MNATIPRRAAIYVRISQDRTGEGAGVARQRDDAHQLATSRGWNVVETLTDNDISAAGSRARPGFERVLELLGAGSVDVVVAWSLDRLTRNRRDTVRLIEAAQKAGAMLALVRGSDMDMATPAGRMTADILASVARNEIEVKSDRQLRANQQARAAGKWVGGRRPFGYEADGVTVREDEAQAVRDAYAAIIDGGSLRAIAAGWNQRGLPTPQGSEWSGPVVSRMLRNPRYAGLVAHRPNGWRAVPYLVDGKPVRAEWPALVDETTWRTALAILNNPKRRPERGDQHLLTGLALCGACDAPVWAGGSPRGDSNYRCRRSSDRSTGPHVNRQRERVDEYVQQVALDRLKRDDVRELLASLAPGNEGPDLAVLMAEADAVRAKLRGLSAAYAADQITMEQMVEASAALRERLAGLEAQTAVSDPAVNNMAALVSADDIETAWEALSVRDRAAIIGALMEIRLDPPGQGNRDCNMEKVRITWRGARP